MKAIKAHTSEEQDRKHTKTTSDSPRITGKEFLFRLIKGLKHYTYNMNEWRRRIYVGDHCNQSIS